MANKVCDFCLSEGKGLFNQPKKIEDGHYICKDCRSILTSYNLPLKHDIFQILVTAQENMRDMIMDSYVKNHDINEVMAKFFPVDDMPLHPGEHCISKVKAGPIFVGLKYIDKLGTAFPPLVGIVLLSVLTDEGKPLLNLGEAMSKGVSWPSLIMCAGTTVLGAAITNSDIGVTAWISGGLSPITSHLPVMIMVFIFILWAAIQTNLSSNMVTATVVSAAALAVTTNITTVNVAALIVNVGMMSAFAFATPPAMPCVAIAVSSGWTNTKQMMVYGFIVMFIAVVISTLIGYPIATALL